MEPLQSGIVFIHVDSCRDGVLSGRYHCPSAGKTGRFSSIMQLLLTVEGFLREGTVLQPSGRGIPESPPFPRRGSLATFRVSILFRRNASWQGTLLWVEGDCRQHFRSVLELMSLISSATRECVAV